MNIRLATPNDADALARVHEDSWRLAYRGLVPDSYLDSLNHEGLAERFRESLISGARETYVAEEAEELLGFMTIGACRDADVDQATTGEIWAIYLAPRHWRKGVGKRLCRDAERMLAARRYTQAVVWVFEGNADARRFYEAMGFVADGDAKMLNLGAALKTIRYRKPLTSA